MNRRRQRRQRRQRWSALVALIALVVGTGIYWWSMGFMPNSGVPLAQPFDALASFAGGLLIGVGLLTLVDTVGRGLGRPQR